jgi:hypothetical protein
MGTLVDKLLIGKEYIEIWQFGPNDFSVNYVTSDASVRGTLLEVMADLNNSFGIFDEQEG